MRRLVCAVLIAIATLDAANAQPNPPRARITEDLRLDANTEDFTVFGVYYVGPRREIVVPLRQDMQLRMYDSTGRRIATVGRRGGGPGEFESMQNVGWVADTMWVYDYQLRRYTFIAPNGTVLRTTVAPAGLTPSMSNSTPVGALDWIVPYALFADGSIVAEGRFKQASTPDKYVWPERRIIRATAAGETRTLVTPPEYENGPWFMTVNVFGNPVPYAPLPQTVFSNDGRRFAFLTTDITSRTGGTFTVVAFRTNGDTIFRKTFPFTGTPIPQRIVDSTLAAMLARRSSEGPSDMAQRFHAIAKERMPPVYAPIQSIILGLDGTTWITLRRTPEGQTAIILNARGDPINTLAVPPRSRIYQASATHVWMTETDADGLTSVVRYRVSQVACTPPECR